MKSIIWNRKDINDLVNMINELKQEAEHDDMRLDDIIDLSDLPTEEIPDKVVMYPVWAMDKNSYCLVGDTLDKIEHINSIMEWYNDKSDNTSSIIPKDVTSDKHQFNVNGYEALIREVKSGSNSSSRINIPLAWKGKKVMVIRLD